MTTRTTVSVTLACVLCSTIAGPAWSQSSDDDTYAVRPASSESESYGVVFDDDPMFALGPDTLIPRLTVRGRPPMAGLLRPRTSFVPELLKSVESF